MAKYKDGVMFSGLRMINGQSRKLEGVSDEVQLAIVVWDELIREEGLEQGTVTALGDGIHSKNSLHYGKYRTNAGRTGYWIDAVDFRTRYLSMNQKMDLGNKLKKKLGRKYDIVIHDTHIHAEYDPK